MKPLLCASVFLCSLPLLASSGAGNGGDVVDRFLIATRQSLVEAIDAIERGDATAGLCECPQQNTSDPFCLYLNRLTSPQRAFCRQFLLTTIDQYRVLNRTGSEIELQLSMAPLQALGPHGYRPVVALTDVGPTGPITFSYSSVKSLSPMNMLAVMAHEFGHKVEFGGLGKYVTDLDPIGPFTFADGGRTLLDSVGSAVARYAADQKLVGQFFGVHDHFTCTITDLTAGVGYPARMNNLRQFRSQDGLIYDAGIGNIPLDDSCSLTETNADHAHHYRIYFNVRIHEENGCAPLTKENNRWTEISLERAAETSGPRDPAPTETLGYKLLKGRNPLCPDDANKEPLALDYTSNGRPYHFELVYDGSSADQRGHSRGHAKITE